MGRLLLGFLPFVFFRIWLRLAIVVGALATFTAMLMVGSIIGGHEIPSPISRSGGLDGSPVRYNS